MRLSPGEVTGRETYPQVNSGFARCYGLSFSLSLFLLLPFRVNYYFFKLFICLFLAMLGLCCYVGFLYGELDCSWLRCRGFLLWWLLLVWSIGCRCTGSSSCSVWAQELWHMGLVAPWSVESSWTKNQTPVSCTGRQIVIHCTQREVFPLFS